MLFKKSDRQVLSKSETLYLY